MDFLLRPVRYVTSPAARRTYLGTALFLITSFVLLCIAAVAYLIFYYSYVPKKVVSVPVHLQYNTGLDPFGFANLASSLMLEQAYDVSVELTVPRSPANHGRGNFMVAMFALKSLPDNLALAYKVPTDPYEHVTNSNVVFASRRPALIPYKDPLVTTASRLLFLLYHIAFPASEKSTLVIPMGELVDFKDVLPLSILLDVQAGQTLQVYSASVTLIARLTGLRWLMYNHRIISFVVCTTMFWLSEMFSMGLAWLILAHFVSGHQKGHEGDINVGKGRGGNSPPERQRSLAGPSRDARTGRLGTETPRIKEETQMSEDEVEVKKEMGEEATLIGSLRHAGDADDEEEGEDLGMETTGSTRYDAKGGSLRRRPSQKGKSTA